MSSAAAEWVRAPEEIRSTPVSAMARTFASVMPPEASVRARPPIMADDARHLRDIHVVEEDDLGAAGQRLLRLLVARDLDLDVQGMGHSGSRRPDHVDDIEAAVAGGGDVVVLDQDAVAEVEAVVVAAAEAYGVALESAEAGRRLARVDDAHRQAGDGVGEGARQRGGAGEALEEVEGDALGREDRCEWPFDHRELGAGLGPGRRLDVGADLVRRVEGEEAAAATGRPAMTPSLLARKTPAPRRSGGTSACVVTSRKAPSSSRA